MYVYISSSYYKRLSIFCCHLCGDKNFSFGNPIGCGNVLFICVSNLFGFSRVVFEKAFVIFPAISFPTMSPVAFAIFYSSFWGISGCTCC